MRVIAIAAKLNSINSGNKKKGSDLYAAPFIADL